MRFRLLFFSLLLGLCSCKAVQTRPNQKVEVVDPDYRILSLSEKTRSGRRPLMWRCFPIKSIEVKYRSWRATDGMGQSDVIVTMCDFEIWVNSKPYPNIYAGRRAKEIVYCNDFKKAWAQLTKDEEYICMDGETSTQGKPEDHPDLKKKVVIWTWDKVKTKKGCYSFWNGYNCVDF